MVVAVDTLAAGDVFHGAFLVRLAEGGTMSEIVGPDAGGERRASVPRPTAREAVGPSDRRMAEPSRKPPP